MITQFYIVTYHHKHGFDTWPEYSERRPDEDGIILKLRNEGSWDDEDEGRIDTYIDVAGPFTVPRVVSGNSNAKKE